MRKAVHRFVIYLFVFLQVSMLLGCGSGQKYGPMITPTLTLTLSPTSTLTPTSTPTPEIIATNTPEPTISAEKQEYISNMISIFETWGDALRELSKLLEDVSGDANLFFEEEWNEKFTKMLNKIEDANQMVDELNPPEGYEEGHAILLDIKESAAKSVELLGVGIDEFNPDKLGQINGYIDQTNHDVARLKDWIEDEFGSEAVESVD
ncbi:MAG: hypothetical protein KGY46_07780 [Anaerolineales bacterium]|nr:hypothetical protein [Anaerolineales bacterium]